MTDEQIKLVAEFTAGFPSLRYFKAHEFLNRGSSNRSGSCKDKNTLPPKHLWKNIYAVAKVWDEVRAQLGRPIKTLSIYRALPYNRCIGSSDGSQHPKGTACDATSPRASAKEIYDVAMRLRQRGFFKGGIGLYVRSNFVHIDVRGTNANWTGN